MISIQSVNTILNIEAIKIEQSKKEISIWTKNDNIEFPSKNHISIKDFLIQSKEWLESINYNDIEHSAYIRTKKKLDIAYGKGTKENILRLIDYILLNEKNFFEEPIIKKIDKNKEYKKFQNHFKTLKNNLDPLFKILLLNKAIPKDVSYSAYGNYNSYTTKGVELDIIRIFQPQVVSANQYNFAISFKDLQAKISIKNNKTNEIIEKNFSMEEIRLILNKVNKELDEDEFKKNKVTDYKNIEKDKQKKVKAVIKIMSGLVNNEENNFDLKKNIVKKKTKIKSI